MGIDALLKRFFPAVLLVLVGIAAYFQASGLGQLVASSVAVDPSSLPAAAPPKRGASPPPANTDHATNGGVILSRNPFDSVTGPLDAKPAATDEAETKPPTAENAGNPTDDPFCDAAKVMLITWSEDPEWSFAALAGGDGKSTLRRVGDDFNGYKVHFIGWDRVWLMSGAGQRCQVMVGGKPPAAGSKVAAAGSASASAEPTGKKPSKSKVPSEISSKIHKISDTHFEVERSVIDQILENQAELMRSVRVVPEKEGDKTSGLRLFGIRPDSLLGTLGMENGDKLQSINGFDINDPTKALEAYTRLRSADHLTVSIDRRGKPLNVDVNIK